MTESVEAPERIWIESEGGCPYFYHEAAAALRAARKVVAWARPLYATEPAEAWEPGDVIDVEFHNRAEKPEGEGWRPLVFADTDDAYYEMLLRERLKIGT